MAPLGRATLLLAFGLVAYALVAGSYAAWKRRRRLALSAQNALLVAFPVTLIAAVVLLVALGRRDMTFVYVWQHTSHKLPMGYALSAFWGGQEGSLLLWLLVLPAYGGLAVGPDGRALDRRDAPLDARRVDVPRRWAADRRPLGVRRDRLGRLLRLGSGRERGAHAVARVDRVPPLGDDPGKARDAEGLEHGAR